MGSWMPRKFIATPFTSLHTPYCPSKKLIWYPLIELLEKTNYQTLLDWWAQIQVFHPIIILEMGYQMAKEVIQE